MFNKTLNLEQRPESLQSEVMYKLIIGINYATTLCKKKKNQSGYFPRPPIYFTFRAFEVIN